MTKARVLVAAQGGTAASTLVPNAMGRDSRRPDRWTETATPSVGCWRATGRSGSGWITTVQAARRTLRGWAIGGLPQSNAVFGQRRQGLGRGFAISAAASFPHSNAVAGYKFDPRLGVYYHSVNFEASQCAIASAGETFGGKLSTLTH